MCKMNNETKTADVNMELWKSFIISISFASNRCEMKECQAFNCFSWSQKKNSNWHATPCPRRRTASPRCMYWQAFDHGMRTRTSQTNSARHKTSRTVAISISSTSISELEHVCLPCRYSRWHSTMRPLLPSIYKWHYYSEHERHVN